jgi:hypothetical protein
MNIEKKQQILKLLFITALVTSIIGPFAPIIGIDIGMGGYFPWAFLVSCFIYCLIFLVPCLGLLASVFVIIYSKHFFRKLGIVFAIINTITLAIVYKFIC